ncbi:ATP-binding protein [Pallidibacillus pasinlerensis]|uniref:histidine kinase n=1 Tax=Pallidibacillus pasinlerensis TaxID=2703818 RepID=A0ABX0A9G2_9BACI|nr:ATP-binding protein [Pallidibacillus pasinlerensis]NCU18855.1 PAS domain-containing protein [Pallidibacillus pasinlerensis]
MSILSQNQTNYDDKLNDSVKNIIQFISNLYNHVLLKSTTKGKINFVTSNIRTLLGYEDHEVLDMFLHDLIHENDRKQLLVLYKSTNSQQLYKISVRMRKKDGIFLPIVLIIYQIHNSDRNLEEFFYVMKEINLTQEESLLQSDKMALIGQLAAGVAHEIRNPLTSLKGFIQLMRSDTKMNHDYLEIMENEIDRIDSISNELMALAKPAPKNYKLHNLQTIFENCMTLLEREAIQKRIKVVRQFLDENVKVYCDEQKIKQVIINLVKNGLEAMDKPGCLTIRIEKNKEYGILYIQDEGTGIPKDLMKKLGQPFFTTKTCGNGLGLMMCYKIIEEHNGKIQVESEWGVGSTFSIYIPTEPAC